MFCPEMKRTVNFTIRYDLGHDLCLQGKIQGHCLITKENATTSPFERDLNAFPDIDTDNTILFYILYIRLKIMQFSIRKTRLYTIYKCITIYYKLYCIYYILVFTSYSIDVVIGFLYKLRLPIYASLP